MSKTSQVDDVTTPELTQADLDRLNATRPSKAELDKAIEEFNSTVNKEWFAGGLAQFTIVIIYGKVTVDLTWPNGTAKTFSGTIWGLGAGTGASAGGGPWLSNYIPPNGKMDFDITGVVDPVGVVTIFWRNDRGQIVGNFTGPGIGAADFSAGGSGTWKNA